MESLGSPSADEASPPDLNNTAAALQRSKRRRQTYGLGDCCRTCRLRKVKCSGNPGHGPCTNCARLDLVCSFVAAPETSTDSDKVSRTTPSRSHTEAGTLRKRAQRACRQCHSHKTKCSGELPRCKRCEMSGLNCEYTPAKRKFSNVPFQGSGAPSEGASPSDSRLELEFGHGNSRHGNEGVASPVDTTNFTVEELLARRDLVLRHFDAFMKYLYNTPAYGIFHPRTTYREIQDGTLRPIAAAALCSVAAFFVSPSETASREFAAKCAETVEFHLFRNFGTLNESNLLIFVLNFTYNFFIGQYGKCWQSQALVSRLVTGLQLNWETHPEDPKQFIQREINRRLVWQIFTNDRHLASGFEEYVLLHEEHMKLRLPCNDEAFRENKPVMMERLSDVPPLQPPPSHLSIAAYYLRLMNVRHHILSITKEWVGPRGQRPSQSRMEPSRVMQVVNSLQNEIARFTAVLPDAFKLSDQNLSKFMDSPDWVAYFLIHIWISHIHIDLYRFALPGIKERAHPDLLRKLPKDFISKSQKQAVAHALSLGRLFQSVQTDFGRTADEVGSFWLVPSVVQVIQVLMQAMQHQLCQDLSDHTTAPLWRSAEASDETVRGLIDWSVSIVAPWNNRVPCMAPIYNYILHCIKEFDSTRRLDERLRADADASKNDATLKLPGPMFLLEAAVQGKQDSETLASAEAAAAARWFQHPPDMAVPETYSRELELEYELMRPEMPIILAHARGMLGPPGGQAQQQYAGDSDVPMDVNRVVPISNFEIPPTGLPAQEGMGLLGIEGEHASLLGGAPPITHYGLQQGLFIPAYGSPFTEGDHGGNYNMHQHGY